MSRKHYRRESTLTSVTAAEELGEQQIAAFSTMHGIPSFVLRLARKHGVKVAVAQTPIRNRRD